MTLPERLELKFEESFNKAIQESILRGLFDSYRDAYNECAGYDYEEQHDLEPFQRWIKFRQSLRGLSKRYDNIEVEPKPNGNGSNYHILIISKFIYLTSSSVSESSSLPRDASHRRDYAFQSQLDLFKPLKEKNLFTLFWHTDLRERINNILPSLLSSFQIEILNLLFAE
ncbi:MAG: hypothetical protein HQK97_05975 [Nitrospirae bacterium]|nr:hypothetical protein [Nitrospirota bacterium]